MAHLARRGARSRSGGEAQRVSLARAFAVEPRLLLLDEPFSALAPPTRALLVPELATRLREAAVAAMVVTHDVEEACILGDRLGIMLAGRIVQLGALEAVFTRPASSDVAEFLAHASGAAGAARPPAWLFPGSRGPRR